MELSSKKFDILQKIMPGIGILIIVTGYVSYCSKMTDFFWNKEQIFIYF